MLEGGGKTPILSPDELKDIGFKIVAYPLSLIGVSIRAMEDALTAIKGGRVPSPACLPSFEEIKETIGFNDYYQEEKRYSMDDSWSLHQKDFSYSPSTMPASGSTIEDEGMQSIETPSDPFVEVITPYVYDNFDTNGIRNQLSQIWSRKLRIKITGRDGFEKLDIRIPAGFLEGISNVIPVLAGINMVEKLKNAAKDVVDNQSGMLLDFNDAMGDRIQVFIE